MAYGVANAAGQVGHDEAVRILEHGRVAGMDTLDTAIAYGTSEQQLGEIGVGTWQVVSKLPALPEGGTDVDGWVRQSVSGSLQRLRLPRLRALLLHRPQQLLGADGAALYSALNGLKRDGLVEKIGVSVYDPGELDALWPRFDLDVVQAPFNVLDRRLQTTGWLERLHQAGAEVHTRSAFLQGLLLMAGERRPRYFSRWQLVFEQWQQWLSEVQLTPLEACLGFVWSHPEINRVVAGVDSLPQLRDILAGIGTTTARAVEPPPLMSQDEDLINPSRWSLR